MFVRSDFDDFSSFQLRPNHESVHWTLNVIGRVFFGLSSIGVWRFRITADCHRWQHQISAVIIVVAALEIGGKFK